MVKVYLSSEKLCFELIYLIAEFFDLRRVFFIISIPMTQYGIFTFLVLSTYLNSHISHNRYIRIKHLFTQVSNKCSSSFYSYYIKLSVSIVVKRHPFLNIVDCFAFSTRRSVNCTVATFTTKTKLDVGNHGWVEYVQT